MKKINSRTIGNIPRNSRHVRWNWEQSPDNDLLVRYHIVVVGNKKRKQVVEKIYKDLGRITGGIEEKRRVEGKVSGSKFRYLLVSFDHPIAPGYVRWYDLGCLVIKEDELYERKKKGFFIESFVADLYS